MVNLSPFERQFWTDAEIKKIEAGAMAFDDMTARRIKADEQAAADIEKRVRGGNNRVADLYQLFEAENMDCINELHQEIGLMKAIQETFPGNVSIEQWTDYFIRLNQVIIENFMEDVIHDRKTASELERIQRR